MYALRIFLSHSMAPADADLNGHIRKTIENQHCEIISGSTAKQGSLSEIVRKAIAACDVAICVATIRPEFRLPDGTYAISPWIQQEAAYATACCLKIIPLLEIGVRDDLKLPGDLIYISFDRNNPVELVHSLSSALGEIQRPPPYMNPIITGVMTGRYVERWGGEVGPLLEVAMIFIGKNEHTKANELFKDALKINRDCWTALINLGVSHVEMGVPDAAMAYYEQVLERCHDRAFRARALHNIGALRESLEPHDDKELARERLAIFQEALSQEPGRINSMYSIFLTNVMLEDYPEAERMFWEAMQHKDFLNHFRRLMSTESAAIIRAIAEHLDTRILNLAFPKQSEGSN